VRDSGFVVFEKLDIFASFVRQLVDGVMGGRELALEIGNAGGCIGTNEFSKDSLKTLRRCTRNKWKSPYP